MPKRRQHGTGSIYRRKSDGKWLGVKDHGYTKTGARRRVTVVAKTEAAAKAALAKKIRELNAGAEVAGRTTVKAWAATWLEMTATTSRPKTHTADLAASKWIVEAIGAKRLEQLTPTDVRSLRTALTKEGRSTSTALRYHGTLMRMLKAAQEEGHEIPSRVLAVRPPTPNVTDRQAIPLPDVKRLLRAADDIPHGSRWLAALLVAMRQGECLGLTRPAVGVDAMVADWQLQALNYLDKHDRSKGFRIPDGYEVRQLDRTMHLVRPKTKAGYRIYPMIPELAGPLAHWLSIAPPSPHDLVWPDANGSPKTAREDTLDWQALQDAAKVRHPEGRYYHVHEARHTAATFFMELKIEESVRLELMGQSSVAAKRGYEHVDLAARAAALSQMAALYELV